ncbi:MAG: MarR family transcriptional regulator [Rhizobiales bacterium]|nr:MarR family transcriptional regulator [Hyphomicrobiales bacterium]
MALELTTAQALQLWQKANLHFVRDEDPDLSMRQMSILLTVYLEAPPHTVRGLASRLNVSKPVITRALDSMGKQNLISRRRDDNDRRNVLIQRTVEGALFIERLADTIMAVASRQEQR